MSVWGLLVVIETAAAVAPSLAINDGATFTALGMVFCLALKSKVESLCS